VLNGAPIFQKGWLVSMEMKGVGSGLLTVVLPAVVGTMPLF